MGETFYWSDPHFQHANINRLAGRPFPTTEACDRVMIENYKKTVSPGDTVHWLGDGFMGKIAESLLLMEQMSYARNVLWCGNHDRPWHGHSEKKREGWYAKYLEAGFDTVYTMGSGTLVHRGIEVNIAHFPYVGDSHDEDRFTDWRPKDDGKWLLHGHVHDAWKVNGRMINVGVDVWDFTPVHVDTLFDIIEGGSGT